MTSRKPVPGLDNICVYCGSGSGHDPAYVEAAREFGRILAKNGVGLVYGGGNLGLMGEIARTVLHEGGHVTGIIPSFSPSASTCCSTCRSFMSSRTCISEKD